MSVTVATGLQVLEHFWVFPECTQQKPVPHICQQKVLMCKYEDTSMSAERGMSAYQVKHLSVTSVRVRQERWRMCISEEKHSMGTAVSVYEVTGMH